MSDSMLEKVRALLAMAERTDNPNERDAFNDKANELIAKYGIEQLNLTREEPLREGIICKIIHLEKPYAIDKASLLRYVALALRCDTIRKRDSVGRLSDDYRLIGFETDVERVELVFSSLLVQMAYGHTTDSMTKRPVYEDPRTYAKSWFLGFIQGAYNKLRAAERAASADGAPGTDVALVDRKDQIARWIKDEFPKLSKGAKRKTTGTGYETGYVRGWEANTGTTTLGRQTSGSKELR